MGVEMTRLGLELVLVLGCTYVMGVEMTSAHGHATTSSTSARYVHAAPVAAPQIHGIVASASAPSITTGVYTCARRLDLGLGQS